VKPLRIGTRGSALALWQANFVAAALKRLHGIECELVRIRTAGDHLQSASVAQINAQSGMKGLFIKELEDALLSEKVDLAVHSMKDVPTETPAGLAFPAITRREDPRDCLIARPARTLQHLPSGRRDRDVDDAAVALVRSPLHPAFLFESRDEHRHSRLAHELTGGQVAYPPRPGPEGGEDGEPRAVDVHTLTGEESAPVREGVGEAGAGLVVGHDVDLTGTYIRDLCK